MKLRATAIAVTGAVMLMSGAALAQGGLEAQSGETVFFRGWQYKTDIVQDNVDRYNNEQAGKVDYATVTGDYPAIMEQNLMAGAELDVLYANPSQAGRYFDGGWIMPAEELPNIDAIKADMYPNILDAWSYKGQLLGLSYFVSTRGAMLVNLQKYYELGYSDADFPKNWDELYDQLYEIRDKGVDQPLLPHWINEWYGISWGFDFEVMNRGGQVAHPDTHEPLLTTDMDGPAYKTLEDWKRIWNDGLVSKEVLTYNESSYIDAYASGRYVFSPQQLYDLETFNREDRSQIAGHASLLPYQGQSWGLLDSAVYLMTSRERSDAQTDDVKRFGKSEQPHVRGFEGERRLGCEARRYCRQAGGCFGHGIRSERAISASIRLLPRRPASGGQTTPLSSRRVAAGDQQIREPQQQRDALPVLCHAPVAHLGVAEVPLHVQERMLNLRPHRRLALLGRLFGDALAQQPAPPRLHRHTPLDTAVPVLGTLLHSLVACVAPRRRLSAMQQRSRLRHVACVGRRRRQAVRQTRPGVHPDVRLHPEIPLLALLRLMHLRVPCAAPVLRRRRRVDDARVNDRPRAQPMAARRQVRIDLLEQTLAQAVLLQQMPEVQDGGLVGQRLRQPQPHETPHRLHLVEKVLHPRVAQVVEQLHAVNTQHHRQRVRAPTAPRLRIERLDPSLQPLPGNQLVHLLKEQLTPRPALLQVVLQFRKACLCHGSIIQSATPAQIMAHAT